MICRIDSKETPRKEAGMKKSGLIMLSVLWVGMLLTGTSIAAKPFYQNKIMTIICSTSPGGGYDYYARMVGRGMKKYLPGVKNIIIKNVPGAGHIIGVNELYRSKPNGLIFGIYNSGLYSAQAGGIKGIKFDLAKLSYLGSAAYEPNAVIFSTKGPYKSLAEAQKGDKEIILASGGKGSVSYIRTLLIRDIFDLKNLKIALGYSGGETLMAIMRGEIHGVCHGWSSVINLCESGDAVPVLFLENRPEGFPNVPLLSEIAKGPKVDYLTDLGRYTRLFAGPPGIPADRLKILREAFKKALDDPEIVKSAEKSDRPIIYASGEDVEKWARKMINQPPEIVSLLKDAYDIK